MCPQSGSVDKDKGKVQMSATVNMKVCSPGDTITVVAEICNSSSKKLKPKVVEHYVKVYLDISFAIDPTIKFPLVIIPSSLAALQSDQTVEPYPAGAFGAPTYTDFPPTAFPPPAFPPPAFPLGPYPVLAGSGAYVYQAPDPSQYANMTSGYNNQWPQPAAPYGFLSAAPPSFQQGIEPPPDMSLFPPPQDAIRRTVSDYKS
ncbi:hypothetical protein PBY51_004212 [Eleginops maclovinus]|uniref:Arrestin C-terminal-like domain-containing protein n=1 Tax=Eleginops maclovinus TaxID=56733 RepID=A0AAN7Y2Q9_ELEMC|nr:hypothetical protein PBY51_004212 [Eleginops maclovinus]